MVWTLQFVWTQDDVRSICVVASLKRKNVSLVCFVFDGGGVVWKDHDTLVKSRGIVSVLIRADTWAPALVRADAAPFSSRWGLALF